MSLVYVGNLTLAGLIPTSFALFASLDAYIQGELTGQLHMQANLSILPPSISATITIAENILADLQAAIALSPPSISLSASLSAQIGILEAFIATLQAILVLSGGSIDVWTWSGPVNGLGPALTGALAGGAPSGGLPTDPSNALVLLTRSPATWTAMSTFFGGI